MARTSSEALLQGEARLLIAMADLEGTGGGGPLSALAERAGLSETDAALAAQRQLDVYVEMRRRRAGLFRTVTEYALTERGRRLVGAWPSREEDHGAVVRRLRRSGAVDPAEPLGSQRWFDRGWEAVARIGLQGAFTLVALLGVVAYAAEWIVWKAFATELGLGIDDLDTSYSAMLSHAAVAAVGTAVVIAIAFLSFFGPAARHFRRYAARRLDPSSASSIDMTGLDAAAAHAFLELTLGLCVTVVTAATVVLSGQLWGALVVMIVGLAALSVWFLLVRRRAYRRLTKPRRPRRSTSTADWQAALAILVSAGALTFFAWTTGAQDGRALARGEARPIPPPASMALPDVACVRVHWLAEPPPGAPTGRPTGYLRGANGLVILISRHDGQVQTQRVDLQSVVLTGLPDADCFTSG